MTHIEQLFDDPFLKAADLEGQDRTVTIAAVTQEEVGSGRDKRPVMSTQETKPIVLNKTNAKRIVQLYGPVVEDWAGRQVIVYPSETEFGGETVDCIRVRREPPQNGKPRAKRRRAK